MNNLEFVVEALLEKYGGGEPYFDALDASLNNYHFQTDLLERIVEDYDKEDIHRLFRDEVFVVSGGFGEMFFKRFEYDAYIILVNGGLREPNSKLEILDANIDLHGLKNLNAIFLDDSLYLSRTLNRIKEDIGIKDVYVIYDGSKTKDPSIRSLYRYYDHYNDDGTKKEVL
jgi:hypothetical protein